MFARIRVVQALQIHPLRARSGVAGPLRFQTKRFFAVVTKRMDHGAIRDLYRRIAGTARIWNGIEIAQISPKGAVTGTENLSVGTVNEPAVKRHRVMDKGTGGNLRTALA